MQEEGIIKQKRRRDMLIITTGIVYYPRPTLNCTRMESGIWKGREEKEAVSTRLLCTPGREGGRSGLQ